MHLSCAMFARRCRSPEVRQGSCTAHFFFLQSKVKQWLTNSCPFSSNVAGTAFNHLSSNPDWNQIRFPSWFWNETISDFYHMIRFFWSVLDLGCLSKSHGPSKMRGTLDKSSTPTFLEPSETSKRLTVTQKHLQSQALRESYTGCC